MKSAVFYGKHDIRIEESPLPPVGENDVLIKVMRCGVCGTDVHIYEGDKGAADTTPPTILGHEFSGIVEQTGPAVKGIKAGDRVCVDPNQLCGSCYYCRSGIGHFCERMVGIGTTVNGGFAQYCSVRASQVYHLADTTSFDEGAMTEPVACCLHGIDLCEITPSSAALVIGGGMIGLIMVQLARLAGAYRVILLEPVAEKREMGKRLGADLCFDPLSENIQQRLSENGISRIDTVIECAGLPGTIAQAIELAGKKSVVMMFGLTRPDEEVAVKPFQIFQKEVTLRASFINPYTQQRALDLINGRKIDVRSMVAAVKGLEGLPDILSQPALRRAGKYIIDPWRED